MKSFSDNIPGTDRVVSPEQLDHVHTAVLTEINILRKEVKKAHFWFLVAIITTFVISGIGIFAAFIHH